MSTIYSFLIPEREKVNLSLYCIIWLLLHTLLLLLLVFIGLNYKTLAFQEELSKCYLAEGLSFALSVSEAFFLASSLFFLISSIDFSGTRIPL